MPDASMVHLSTSRQLGPIPEPIIAIVCWAVKFKTVRKFNGNSKFLFMKMHFEMLLAKR